MRHSTFCKTAWALTLISLKLLAMATAEIPAGADQGKMPEHMERATLPPPLDLKSILMGPKDSRYTESSPKVTNPTTQSEEVSENDLTNRLDPSSVMNNFDRENFMKVFTYDVAPELDVPRNESVAYLLEIMTEINDQIDKLILQAFTEVSEYYSKIMSPSDSESSEPSTPGELYDLVYKNLIALLGTLDDYPVLKEGLYLWSSSDDDPEAENVPVGPTGREFKFSTKNKDQTPSKPKFICPDHMTDLVNCVSYDVFDSVADNAKYYFNPFGW